MVIQDPMTFGIQITIIGLTVVFLSLFLISLIVSQVLGRVDGWVEQLSQRGRAKSAEKVESLEEIPSDTLSPELLAAISAAVTVAIGKKIQVKRIRYRRAPAATNWSVQGRATIMGSHQIKRY